MPSPAFEISIPSEDTYSRNYSWCCISGVRVYLICCSSIIMMKNRRILDASILVPGTPVNFPFVNLQIATNNFRERLGTGMKD